MGDRMSYIVERLERGIVLSNSPELLREAVAEIRRLRLTIEQLRFVAGP